MIASVSRRLVGLSVLATCLGASPAFAAPARSVQMGTTFGLGTGLHHTLGSDAANAAPWTVYLPIQLATLRLEPEIGVRSVTVSSEADGDEFTESATVFRLGVGVSYTAWLTDAAIHVGARVGFIRNSGELTMTDFWGDESTYEFLRTDLFLSPMLGAELYLTRALSLGLEAQLETVFAGDAQVLDPDGDLETTKGDRTDINTRGVLFLRFYFI